MVGSQQTEDIINRGGQIFSEIASSDRKAAFVTPYKKYVTSGWFCTGTKRAPWLLTNALRFLRSVQVRQP
jgi:hypothetical protein